MLVLAVAYFQSIIGPLFVRSPAFARFVRIKNIRSKGGAVAELSRGFEESEFPVVYLT